MIKKTLYNTNYPLQVLPIIEVNQQSTAQGEVRLTNEDIEEITTLAGEVYLVTPPTLSNDYWDIQGVDLYTVAILKLTSRKIDTGELMIKYSFDPSAISGIDNLQYYSVIISVNAADVAVTPQAGIELIFKIKNRIL